MVVFSCDQLRSASPVLHAPLLDLWMVFDYEGVKRALSDHEAFSSAVPAPPWLVFFDPPRHTKLRALITRAFTPRVEDVFVHSRLTSVVGRDYTRRVGA